MRKNKKNKEIRLQKGAKGYNGTLLVLGGARSGKSHFAENCIRALPSPWVYLATGWAYDEEMYQRITRHQADRGHEGWLTVEEPLEVGRVLQRHTHSPVLLDCLTLWLTNLLLEKHDIPAATTGLLESLSTRQAPTVLVGNEVGLGIVPENALARRFRDEAGRLHQALACVVGQVVFMAAGLPLVLKNETKPHKKQRKQQK
ncbi:MAG: bifunctional adenosylcobinamide kinase/adenosylcobinamide-phosphate guanylyltransferase [Acetobacter sp.]|nr:bifunctional adenosylcobinamide kinase/adenosylcobinamide-phosphate guanylyltransferase [Acetobacter sp.]